VASLTDYFEQDVDEGTYTFALSSVTPTCATAVLVGGLAGLMSRNKSDPQVTADLLATAGWTASVAALRKGRLMGWSYPFASWDDEIAENLDDLPDHLPELSLRLFPLVGAIDLIEEVYAKLIWDVSDDD
jgi:hypothetical protein